MTELLTLLSSNPAEGADVIDRLASGSSEGGMLFELFDLLRPVGVMIDSALNLLAAVMNAQ